MPRGKPLNQQAIAVLVVAVVLLIVGVLVFGNSAGLFGTAADTPTPEAQVLDSDGDGVLDPDDACPNEAGTLNGCPDRDGDGIADANDTCPDEAAPGTSDGCPLPEPTLEPTSEPVVEQPTVAPTEVALQATEVSSRPTLEPTIEPTTEEPTAEPTADTLPDATVEPTPEIVPSAEPQATDDGTAGGAADVIANFEPFTNPDGSIHFIDRSSGPVSAWSWDFGNGHSSTEQSPTYFYPEAGQFTARLTVSNSGGQSSTAQAVVTVTEAQAAPATCNFSSAVQNSGLPAQVLFTNTSSNIASYAWNFGNGDTSTNAGPHTISYAASGNYAISLVCTTTRGETLNASGTVSVSETGAQQPLIASFIANPTRGAAPLSVTLTDNSTSDSNDPIVAWAWNFGNGQTATGKGPHSQSFAEGNYVVSLTVTTQSGATASTGGNIEALTVHAQPRPSIAVSPSVQGDAPFSVTINGANSGGPITTWTWDFGNGQTATGQGPHAVSYATAGTYNVTLNVEGPGGTGFAQQSIVVTNPGAIVEAIFSYSFTAPYNNGQEVCFSNQSTGSIASYSWNFGDGGTSTDASPCHTYAALGSYTVTLSVVGTNPAETSSSQRIVPIVTGNAAPDASFTVNRNSISVGDTVQLTNTSTGIITSYSWTFGDGGTSTDENPSHTYTQEGTFVIELTVTGPGGTSQAAQTSITVSFPTINCTISGSSSANYYQSKSYSVSISGLNGRTPTYNWTLTGPNGISVSDTNATFTYQFKAVGAYTLNVEVSIDGVISCTQSKNITVNPDNLVCNYTGTTTPRLLQEVTYRESGVNNLNGRTITSRSWKLDGVEVSTSNSYKTTWTTAGTYTLEYTITLDDGTPCTVSKQIVVSNSSLECSISGDTSAYFYQTKSYTANVTGPSGARSYAWTVDGTPVGGNSNSLSYQFTTVGKGSYVISVTITQNGEDCIASITVTINNSGNDGLTCDYSGDTSPLLNQTVTYDGTYSRDYGRTLTFTWAVINRDTNQTVATGNTEDFTYQWTASGRFRVVFTVTPDVGNPCERSRNITVNANAVVCTLNGPDSIYVYQSGSWSFTGDSGNPSGLSTRWLVDGVEVGTSSSINHTFTAAGSHTITLELLQNGVVACTRTKTVNVQTDNLTCQFWGDFAPLLLSTPYYSSQVSNLYGRTATYEWFVDGSSVATTKDLQFQWTASGSRQLRLVVTPSQGDPCQITKTVIVANEALRCEIRGEFSPYAGVPQSYASHVDGLGSLTASYTWSLDGVQISTDRNLNYEFDTAGSATLTLGITTNDSSVSCTVDANLNIRAGQSINAVATPNSGIAPLQVAFTAQTENIDRSTLTWRYPDGSTHRSEDSSFLFTTPGQYTVRVTGRGPVGTEEASVVVNVGTDSVIRAAFTPQPFNGLVGTQICFPDGSDGEQINSWEWDLDGDGVVDVSNTDNSTPCYTYNQVGDYRVKLTVRNVFGLQAEATNIVRIYETSSSSGSIGVDIQAGGLVCFTSILQAGDNVVEWDFGDGSAPSTDANPCHTFLPGDYTVALKAQGQTIYTIIRNITVVIIPAAELPNLSLVGICVEPVGAEPFARFTITNSGGNMPQIDHYTVVDGLGALVDEGDFSLIRGQSLVLEYPNRNGLTLTTRDSQLARSVDPCYKAPDLSASGVCNADGTVSFTLTNNGGPMASGIPYTISAAGNTLQSGTTRTLGDGESQTFTVNALNDGATIDFSAGDGALTASASTVSCYALPDVSASGVCNADGTLSFTFVNNGGPMTSGLPYTISDGAGIVESGTTNALNTGESQDFTVDALNSGATITFVAGNNEATASVQNCYALPDIDAVGVCNGDGTVSFELTNSGGPMTSGLPYEISTDSSVLDSGTTNALASGASQIFTVNALNDGAEINFYAGDDVTFSIHRSVTDCYALPDIDAAGVCNADGTVSFTLTNNGGPMTSGIPYTISTASGNLDSGTSNALDTGESQIFTVNALADGSTIEFEATDGSLSATANTANCLALPDLAASGVCNADGTASFTLTNNGGPMSAGIPYEISANGSVLDAGTTRSLSFGESQTFTVNALPDGATIDFSADDGNGLSATASVADCYALPDLVASGVCNADGTASFTLTNNGGPMSVGEAYQIEDGDGNVLDAGTTNALNYNESQTFTVNALPTGSVLNFWVGNSASPSASASVQSCYALPDLAVTGVCNGDGTVSFTLTNNGGPMTSGLSYTIETDQGQSIDAGVSRALNYGESQVFTVPATNSGDTITFSVAGQSVSASVASCYALPDLIPSAVCEKSTGHTTYTVVNNGGDMLNPADWEVSDASGTVVADGTLQLKHGETFSHTITDVQGTLTFTVLGYNVSVTSTCYQDANIVISGYCNDDNSISFSITNNGGNMANISDSVFYVITDVNGVVLDQGSFVLDAGETQIVTVQSDSDEATLSITLASGPTASVSVKDCVEVVQTPTPTPTVPVTDEPVCAAITYDDNGFPIIDMSPDACVDSGIERAVWTPIEVGAAVCPNWLIYHSNKTSLDGEVDWEIFRLGGEDQFPDADYNLSQGLGDRVFDIAPSRAPDAQWITFASTRDGNWEIYIAPIDNGPNSTGIMQRLTYNTVAIDMDPVWSPGAAYDAGSLIVYESSRDGQWDLYMLDVRTGVEEQLTNNEADELNAFWSPDGTKVIYQSDRDGFWQIYELDLTNRDENGLPVETKLSDGNGDDHDPMYSNEGDRIVFRSYRDGDTSVIYVMDADGSNVVRISDPAANASNATWSPNDALIAYQSDLDVDLDIYVYEFESETTRLVTDNETRDYAPTWYCESTTLVFSSDVDGDPNIFSTDALPIEADAIIVEEEASRLTDDPAVDYYPQNSPSEENASRQGQLPRSAKNK